MSERRRNMTNETATKSTASKHITQKGAAKRWPAACCMPPRATANSITTKITTTPAKSKQSRAICRAAGLRRVAVAKWTQSGRRNRQKSTHKNNKSNRKQEQPQQRTTTMHTWQFDKRSCILLTTVPSCCCIGRALSFCAHTPAASKGEVVRKRRVKSSYEILKSSPALQADTWRSVATTQVFCNHCSLSGVHAMHFLFTLLHCCYFIIFLSTSYICMHGCWKKVVVAFCDTKY